MDIKELIVAIPIVMVLILLGNALPEFGELMKKVVICGTLLASFILILRYY